jgi:Fe2+ transport system protein FeoA
MSISDSLTRLQAIRFGIGEGTVVGCSEIIPGGPIIINRCKQQVALGRKLAGKINVVLEETNLQ